MLKAGISQTQVARNLGVHRQCVIRWKKRMDQFDFEEAVKNEKRDPKPGSDKRAVITQAQQMVIRQTIVDHTLAQLGLGGALWTTKTIQLLIKEKFQVDVNRRTLARYLKAWGFISRRLIEPESQPDSKAAAIWLERSYPAIEEKAKREMALIFWVKETEIFQDNNKVPDSIPVGQILLFPPLGMPSMLSAVNNQGKVYFKIERDTVDAEIYLQFLKDLLKDNAGRKIYVIANNMLIHQSKIVYQWAEENSDKVALYQFALKQTERVQTKV